MEKIKATIDGRMMETEAGTTILELLETGSIRYEDNPVSAAYANGCVVSLKEKLMGSTEIRTIRAASPEGKRVYRKSICFLLCYASALTAPERTLIIGHSLGDGYYFRYRDGRKPDTEALKAAMNEAVRNDLPIDLVTLTAEEALEYSRRKNLAETGKLLLSENASSYRFARLGDCYEMDYEPMVPSAGYLGLWELMDYEGGLLLRYPQTRSPFRILPFSDNPLLFSVFFGSFLFRLRDGRRGFLRWRSRLFGRGSAPLLCGIRFGRIEGGLSRGEKFFRSGEFFRDGHVGRNACRRLPGRHGRLSFCGQRFPFRIQMRRTHRHAEDLAGRADTEFIFEPPDKFIPRARGGFVQFDPLMTEMALRYHFLLVDVQRETKGKKEHK